MNDEETSSEGVDARRVEEPENGEESKDEEFLGDMEDDEDEYSAAGDGKFKENPASANGDL
jgi:hypothetical protein